MRASESFAHVCFEFARPTMRLQEVRSQSNGEHDFDIFDASGNHVGVLEVTMAADRDQVSTMSALFDTERGSGVAPRRKAKACWSVSVDSDVRINRVRAELDDYLAAIEEAGLDEFDASSRVREARAIRRELKIRSGHIHSVDIDGLHLVASPTVTAWTDALAVNRAVAKEAAKPDNLRKLSALECRERHLFVFVDMSSLGAYAALQHSAASPEPPSVDSRITHVWAGTHKMQGHGGVFWCAPNGGDWTRGEVSTPYRPEDLPGI